MSKLNSLPGTYAATRDALHRVAEEVVAPARKPHNEIALTVTPGGFGTPEFEHEGRRIQVRVDGAEIVIDTDDCETRSPITTIADVAATVGDELFPEGMPDDDGDLGVDAEAAERLGEFYDFADSVLQAFKDTLGSEEDASSTNLWPEHFDVAFEAGAEGDGARANYGASPGDATHPEPYLYVGPWTAEVSGELWNGAGFNGAELTYAELLDADNSAAAAVEFFESRHANLNGD
jgi:hypothetical protein